MDWQHFLVEPGSKVKLEDVDISGKKYFDEGKDDGLKELLARKDAIAGLQERLYAEHKQRLLIVLQAMDTAGKDGTISAVFDGINPQGVHIANFKAPTATELDHDYLWRIHAQTPAKGEIVVFNRSHYEDVLVARVHKLVPEAVWSRRYRQINEFERMLVEEGTTIVKFYLHIDQDIQKERLLDRIDTPEKNWKFNPGDLDERKLWPEYMKAYEDALMETSTEYAPWYIVPGAHNWVRNLVVAGVVADTLEKMNPHYPPPVENIAQYRDKLE